MWVVCVYACAYVCCVDITCISVRVRVRVRVRAACMHVRVYVVWMPI